MAEKSFPICSQQIESLTLNCPRHLVTDLTYIVCLLLYYAIIVHSLVPIGLMDDCTSALHIA